MTTRIVRQHSALFMAWLIALVSLLSTLYLSEVISLPVCNLCWYQRICIYPLVIVLGIAAVRNDKNITIYTIPLALLGALFAFIQYLEQIFPKFFPINLCGTGPSCETIHMKILSFVTFPFISLIACLFITLFLVIAQKS